MKREYRFVGFHIEVGVDTEPSRFRTPKMIDGNTGPFRVIRGSFYADPETDREDWVAFGVWRFRIVFVREYNKKENA